MAVLTPRHSDLVLKTIQSPNMAAQSLHAASWVRSVFHHGLDPEVTRDQELLSGHELIRIRDKEAKLLSVAVPILNDVYNAVGSAGCCVVLTTKDGLILESRTTYSEAKDFENARLTTGAVWSEAKEGTNGIGTCLTEDRPVIIHRNQHFAAKNIGMSCIDAPLRDHRGRLMGALDISTCRPEHNEAMCKMMGALVIDAARKIESDFFRQAFLRARIIHAGASSNSAPALLAIDSDDLIIGATRAARKIYNLTDEIIDANLPAKDLFDLDAQNDEWAMSERAILRRALARTSGNVVQAAKVLGIGRATFYRRMKRCGLD